MNVPEPYEWRLRELSLENLGVSCDWGECNRLAVMERLNYTAPSDWLPVCIDHIFGGQR